MRTSFLGALGAAGLAAGLAIGSLPSIAADHLEAPLVQQDGRTDIADLYAFNSPDNPANTVLVMTVNPVAGVLSPETFDKDAQYRFRVDTDGDARHDRTIRVDFGFVRPDGNQPLKVRGMGGFSKGPTEQVLDLAGGGRAYAGTFDDPFFFDFQAFQDQVKAAGGPRTFCDGDETDFFTGLNVSGIVVEIPTVQLTGGATGPVGIWAETSVGAERKDRMGRPAIATALVRDGREDFFNRARPHQDAKRFTEDVKGTLLALSGLDGSGYTDDEAQAITDVLLPDVLTYDPAQKAEYLNGRALTDDVIDLSLTVVTGGFFPDSTPVLTGDCVDANDVPFELSFPYLAAPHGS